MTINTTATCFCLLYNYLEDAVNVCGEPDAILTNICFYPPSVLNCMYVPYKWSFICAQTCFYSLSIILMFTSHKHTLALLSVRFYSLFSPLLSTSETWLLFRECFTSWVVTRYYMCTLVSPTHLVTQWCTRAHQCTSHTGIAGGGLGVWVSKRYWGLNPNILFHLLTLNACCKTRCAGR